MNQPTQPSQFWLEVVQAHDSVAINHEQVITVARDGKRAEVRYSEDFDVVMIFVEEVETETVEPLPVP